MLSSAGFLVKLEITNLFSDSLGIVADLREFSQAEGASNYQQLRDKKEFNMDSQPLFGEEYQTNDKREIRPSTQRL